MWADQFLLHVESLFVGKQADWANKHGENNFIHLLKLPFETNKVVLTLT
jgi:hypothetical protein